MKKTTRIKAPAILNRAAFEVTVDTIATATTRLRLLETSRDLEVQKAQARHADEIAELQQQIDLAAGMCEKYAEEHRAELIPGKTKSSETPLARYGFRTGNPTLKTLAKWTWDKVLAALDERQMGAFVRVKREVDKETILKDGAEGYLIGYENNRSTDVALATIGVRIAQAETFFIEPKVDGADTVKAGGAS